MGGGGTSGNSEASYSTTASDSSTVKILFSFESKPTFSASDRKLQIARAGHPHLIRLRNDISYEDFKKNLSSLRPASKRRIPVYEFTYFLPGQGLIALRGEQDMRNMIEEFDELNREQGPQMFKVFGYYP